MGFDQTVGYEQLLQLASGATAGTHQPPTDTMHSMETHALYGLSQCDCMVISVHIAG
jgi:hypothetical protein